MQFRYLIILCLFAPYFLSAQELENHGYFRTRTKFINQKDLYSSEYLESRLRWEPEIKINENLSILMQMDVDGFWGESAGIFDIDSGGTSSDFKFNRAWLRYMTPVGLLEIGRMPSDWGLGIFTNDGNGFDDLFGDNYNGDTFDRILFGTKPFGRESPLTTAIIYDQVSTGLPGNVDDDVSELILALLYTELHWIAGAYGGMREQKSTSTEAYFGDVYLKLSIIGVNLEAESVYLHGHTRALQTSLNPGKYIIDQAGAAGRLSYSGGFFEPAIEVGFASGDNNPFNRHVTHFTFHRDYNVGLILYEQVLARLTEAMYQNFYTLGEYPPSGSDKFSTNGGVTNSVYVYPAIKFRVLDELDAVLAGLYARSIFPFIDLVELIKTNNEKNLMGGEPSKELGWEVDAGAEWEFIKNFKLGAQGGYFSPGGAFKDSEGKAHPAYTVQGRFTWMY
jgi:hypothetical protein